MEKFYEPVAFDGEPSSMGKAQPKVLSIGQCGIDGPAIKR